jgi:type II secretory pathway pseudopilin PulG
MARSERGEFTLVGLLVAMVIFMFVLMATYDAFDVFSRNVRDNQVRTASTDRARLATDRMARQLRNLATPTALQPDAVALASPYDVIFETVAPTGTPPVSNPQNIEFVRYCLDATTGRFWGMEMPPETITSATAAPATPSACPGSGWSNVKVMSQDVVNRYNGADRPVFTFDAATNNQIRRVRIDLFLDLDPGKGPKEQQVTTGVNLRNQDEAPTAAFSWAPSSSGIVLLDGSASTDPDNDPLEYCWYDPVATGSIGDCGDHSIGASPYFRYRGASGTHTITLTVTDPSGLPNSITKQVAIS